ncbi:MAG: DUF1566 domain-containing protein [Burkholderiales bacterium]
MHNRTSQIILGLILSSTLGQLLAADNQSAPVANPPNPRYVIKGGEVYDKKSDLTWQRCSVGQRWVNEAKGCRGLVKTFTFDDARALANGTWRVPTVGELKTLIDYDRTGPDKKPTIDDVAFPNMDRYQDWYWTSEPGGASGGWVVLFHNSLINDAIYYRGNTGAVRLVRRGQ